MNEIVTELLTHLDESQRELWFERAGIMEYDGGLTRDHAECLAMLYLLKKYHTQKGESYLKDHQLEKENTNGRE
jgi:hypothetical protein